MNLDSLFTQLEELNKKTGGNSNEDSLKDYVQFKQGKNLRCRLILDVTDPKKSISKLEKHEFQSKVTGEKLIINSLSTIGQRDPIGTWTFAARKANDPRVSGVSWSCRYKARIYVIDDQANPNNNGTIKIVAFGKSLKDKIDAAIADPDYGKKIFDLSANGCDFVIKCTEKAGYNNYDSSSFSPTKDIGLDKKKIDQIYEEAQKLKLETATFKTAEEIQEIFDVHFLGKEPGDSKFEPAPQKKQEPAPQKKVETAKQAQSASLIDDPELQSIIDGFDVGN